MHKYQVAQASVHFFLEFFLDCKPYLGSILQKYFVKMAVDLENS